MSPEVKQRISIGVRKANAAKKAAKKKAQSALNRSEAQRKAWAAKRAATETSRISSLKDQLSNQPVEEAQPVAGALVIGTILHKIQEIDLRLRKTEEGQYNIQTSVPLPAASNSLPGNFQTLENQIQNHMEWVQAQIESHRKSILERIG